MILVLLLSLLLLRHFAVHRNLVVVDLLVLVVAYLPRELLVRG